MDQPTFAELEFRGKKRKTRRELFLERMDGLIPWQRLEERIRPVYLKAGKGRQPYPLAVMLRIHCVQLFYNLSDPGTGIPGQEAQDPAGAVPGTDGRPDPWQRLEERIRPADLKAGKGRQPYPLAVMLRIHCVQLFYNLSDPGMEDPRLREGGFCS